MAKHNDLGNRGEKIAVRHLEARSYSVLETNWRCGRLEVDIIARLKDQLVVAEVKTRMGDFLESPLEAVNKRKQQLLIRAANAYISKSNLNLDIRFDIIVVIFSDDMEFQVYQIENAFYPCPGR